MTLRIPITVELDDGRELKVVVDQRDFAAAEAQEIGKAQKHTWVRFLAWSALARGKQYTGSWEQFNAVDCVEATDVAEEPAGVDEGLDPGRSAPAGGS